MVLGCGEKVDTTPIKIGLAAPQSGPRTPFGDAQKRAAQLALSIINEHGGIHGRPLELVVGDDLGTPDGAAAAVDALIADGITALIGPLESTRLAAAKPAIDANEVVTISPNSSAISLAVDDYIFRLAPTDTLQTVAMVRYFRQLSVPQVNRIAIVHESGTWSTGVKNTLQQKFVEAGGQLAAEPYGYPHADIVSDADVANIWNQIAALSPPPDVIVPIVFVGDANKLLKHWGASGQLPGVKWFLADAAKNSALFKDLPAAAELTHGSSSTSPKTGDAVAYFESTYKTAYPDLDPRQSYLANTWDSVFSLALAMEQQLHNEKAIKGGGGLKTALSSISKEGQVMHAGQWADMVAIIKAGGDVDYDGASGPCDFDELGETIGPYEIWQVKKNTTGAFGFEQAYYVEARDLATK